MRLPVDQLMKFICSCCESAIDKAMEPRLLWSQVPSTCRGTEYRRRHNNIKGRSLLTLSYIFPPAYCPSLACSKALFSIQLAAIRSLRPRPISFHCSIIMSGPSPPARTSSLNFNEAQQAQYKSATLKRKQAQESLESSKSCDSVEYWKSRNDEEEATLEIIELEWEAQRAGFKDSKDIHAAERDYMRKKAEARDQSEAAKRKIDRYVARAALVSSDSTKDAVSMRSAYLELMLSLLNRTSRAQQGSFVEDLRSAYGHKKEGKVLHVWCPVTGDWEPRASVKAAHIFPACLGQSMMSYVFGPDADRELNSAKNGLFLPHTIEEAFDRHQVVIVPGAGPKGWKFMVLDRSGLWTARTGTKKTFADLHNEELQFRSGNDFRPRARYLYFHYLLAMLRIGRSGVEEKAIFLKQVTEAATPALLEVWASGGKYMRGNMIRAFIEGMAHEWPELDPAALLEHAEPDREDDSPAMVRSGVEADINSDEEEDDEGY